MCRGLVCCKKVCIGMMRCVIVCRGLFWCKEVCIGAVRCVGVCKGEVEVWRMC